MTWVSGRINRRIHEQIGPRPLSTASFTHSSSLLLNIVLGTFSIMFEIRDRIMQIFLSVSLIRTHSIIRRIPSFYVFCMAIYFLEIEQIFVCSAHAELFWKFNAVDGLHFSISRDRIPIVWLGFFVAYKGSVTITAITSTNMVSFGAEVGRSRE